ncbi:TAXI family TRAP transporter solute-binding subunit [Rhodospirillaceae bacterium SYSU D60014]|uniref:TAXI family TRAP transporter solute-binding subunit n=1 Tax=Virgifigura deserti TaxID=2268457 RepID=UPI000E663839
MRLKTILCGLAGLVLSAAVVPNAEAQDDKFISFGSSASGSSQYVYAGMLIGMARPHLPEMSITNEAVSGTTQNLDLLRRGEVQMAIVSPERLHAAYHGQASYEGQPIPATILWVMNEQATVIFTRADSSIKSIDDLRGKRVAIGPAGSSNEIKNAFILEAHGFTRTPDTKSDFNELTTVKLSHSEAANALAEGAIDAAIATQPVPDPSFAELSYSVPLRYIGVEKEKFGDVAKLYRWMWPTTVKAGSFKGLDQDLLTLGDRNYVIAHRDNLSEKAAYDITKTYVEKLLPEMAKQADYLLPFAGNPKALTGPWAVPGHPGAVKYYTERGLTPDVTQ